ncbi:TetR/AcrR family transcriptional regulator [Kitasatospora arboriphila]
MIETPSVDGPRLTGRGAARRTELFEELTALLIAEGFAQLTLDDLAARLRCSKRTLYGLAGSKEQLVRAAVVHFFRRATVRVEAALAAETDPAARLAAYLRAVAAELSPVSGRFFDDVAAFEPPPRCTSATPGPRPGGCRSSSTRASPTAPSARSTWPSPPT